MKSAQKMNWPEPEQHELETARMESLAAPQVAERPGFGARLLRGFAELVEVVLIAGVLFVLVNLVTARVRVESISMEPSLHAGEFVVVNKLAYRWKPPERGDIIVFRFPLDPDKRYIKRVIGLPGDTVEAREGRIYVNGIPLDEPYLAAPPAYTGQWRVEAGHVFVLGDNRNNSNDSKNWGSLDMDAIIGKAVLIYWPPENLGFIPHYDLVHAGGG